MSESSGSHVTVLFQAVHMADFSDGFSNTELDCFLEINPAQSWFIVPCMAC